MAGVSSSGGAAEVPRVFEAKRIRSLRERSLLTGNPLSSRRVMILSEGS